MFSVCLFERLGGLHENSNNEPARLGINTGVLNRHVFVTVSTRNI